LLIKKEQKRKKNKIKVVLVAAKKIFLKKMDHIQKDLDQAAEKLEIVKYKTMIRVARPFPENEAKYWFDEIEKTNDGIFGILKSRKENIPDKRIFLSYRVINEIVENIPIFSDGSAGFSKLNKQD
jgi:hypothetical protein